MSIWKKCKMEYVYYSDDYSDTYPCVVKIDDENILVEYDSDGVVQYEGKSKGEGHFELNGVGFDGRATLHMFSGSKLLEGGWSEEGDRGMWRIWLA